MLVVNKVKIKTIKSRVEFTRLIKKGSWIYVNSWMVLNFEKKQVGDPRFGWTLPKYVGAAVVRNRIKRWCREIAREVMRGNNICAVDINIVLRKRSKEFYKSMKYETFKAELQPALQKIIKPV